MLRSDIRLRRVREAIASMVSLFFIFASRAKKNAPPFAEFAHLRGREAENIFTL